MIDLQSEMTDCKKTNCKHYLWLGCRGADELTNQISCALPLAECAECINNNHSKFEDGEIECPECGYKIPKTVLENNDDLCPKCHYDIDDTIRVLERFYGT